METVTRDHSGEFGILSHLPARCLCVLPGSTASHNNAAREEEYCRLHTAPVGCGSFLAVATHSVLNRTIFWCRYVGDQDLEFFKERVEVPGEVKGAGPWEHMMYKDFGSFTYEAWRRSLTVCDSVPDAVGRAFMPILLQLVCLTHHMRPM